MPGVAALRAVHEDALRADADIGAEDGTEGQRRMAHLERHFAFLRHRQADTAVLLRNGQAEQAHRLDVFHHIGRYVVAFLHRIFRRYQAVGHETLHGCAQQFERFVVQGHGSLSLQ
jgi:hypothetical protein